MHMILMQLYVRTFWTKTLQQAIIQSFFFIVHADIVVPGVISLHC